MTLAGSSSQGWRLIEARAHEGFAFGLRYPSLVNIMAVPATPADRRASASARIMAALASERGEAAVEVTGGGDEDTRQASVRWFLRLADRFNDLAGLPIADRSKCLFLNESAVGCVVPCLAGSLGAMHALLEHVRGIVENPQASTDDDLRRDFGRLRSANLATSNGPRLFRAAIENGIVVQQLPGRMVQYGLGRNAAVMDSTFTPYTSLLGTRIARRKSVASEFLDRQGLPVAAHRLAEDVDDAIGLAQELGYPVVVKPNDQDGGAAVRADLRNQAEVREAFGPARALTNEVMVQKHCPGRDYRLTVFRGEVVWAIERRPAGVVGDGAASIAQLVSAANAEPGRGEGPHARLKRIRLGEEATALLARDGRSTDSVPGQGEFVRLRRSSNVSSGGTPIAVMDAVHPENAKLAVRAAQAVNLDLAGIDLIMPDISRPWNHGDTIICEVNAGPEIGGTTSLHIYPQLLASLLDGDGNVPVVAFYGGQRAQDLAGRIAGELQQQGFTPGLHAADGVFVGSECVKHGNMTCLAGGRLLAGHPSVAAILLAVVDEGVLKTGLPVPRIDVLIIAPDGPLDARAAAVLGFLDPCCAQTVLVGAEIASVPPRWQEKRRESEPAVAAEVLRLVQSTKFSPGWNR